MLGIAADNGFADLRQVRISGASIPTGTLPDNGSTLALLAGSGFALALLRRQAIAEEVESVKLRGSHAPLRS
jgi:hypothetical protein